MVMKKGCSLSAAILGFIAFACVAPADPTEPTGPDGGDPNIRYDRDGVPLTVTQKQADRATPEQIAAARKQQIQAALDKDWLLRGYEKQLQARAAASANQDPSANPYLEISANKDLARLAGMPDLEADDSDKPLLHATEEQPDRPAATLHPGSTQPQAETGPFGSSFLRPMITPLSAPEAAGLNNFYASLPVAGLSPFYGNPQTQGPAPASRVSVIPDETKDDDIDTPGMIAAEKNPLQDPSTSDLTLDVLPEESIEHARAHQDNSEALLQLPVAIDADQLHRAQAASLNPPVAQSIGAQQTAATAPAAKPTPVEDQDEPMQAAKIPVINPVRAPIASPFDILNR
jgi:hypothetical protein